VCLGLGAAAAALLCCGSRGLSGAARLQGVAFTATLSGGSSGSRSPRVSRQGGAARPSRLRAVRGDRQQEEEFDEEEEEDQTVYYGGQRRPRQVEEDSEQMRIASRINQALAMRRAPKAAPIQLVETAWYDELGVEPSATQEDIRLRYLDHAADVEERLAYLLEEGGSYEEEMMQKDDDRDSIEDDEDWDAKDAEPEELALQESASLTKAPSNEDLEESAIIAEEFVRLSNLYQILSVPQLRKIYDEGGVEGLAMKVPMLAKGLLEPEKVLKMARGIKTPTKVRESLLLRKEPRQQVFARYQAMNSVRQVLRRLTDVFRVWNFKSPASLQHREGTIYTELPEIAVFGRVNSGKSALIQHMLSAASPRKNHLASVAQRPGKTKGVDVFCVNRRFTVADTAGYGRGDAKHESAQDVSNEWRENWKPLMKDYLHTTNWLRAAIYVHDIGKDVIKQDIETVKMLREAGIPVLLVFTKDDKVDSDTMRTSRVRYIRRKLNWPLDHPHAHYTVRRGGYGQVFKNMVGTMMFGLLSTEKREDAFHALENELTEVFWDYRDKYVPKPRTFFGKVAAPKRVRRYHGEDKTYTDDDLQMEEDIAEKKELRGYKKRKEDSGQKWTSKDDVEQERGPLLTPKERRQRWEDMLQEARGSR